MVSSRLSLIALVRIHYFIVCVTKDGNDINLLLPSVKFSPVSNIRKSVVRDCLKNNQHPVTFLKDFKFFLNKANNAWKTDMARVCLSTLNICQWEVKAESFREENGSRNKKCWKDPSLQP